MIDLGECVSCRGWSIIDVDATIYGMFVPLYPKVRMVPSIGDIVNLTCV